MNKSERDSFYRLNSSFAWGPAALNATKTADRINLPAEPDRLYCRVFLRIFFSLPFLLSFHSQSFHPQQIFKDEDFNCQWNTNLSSGMLNNSPLSPFSYYDEQRCRPYQTTRGDLHCPSQTDY